MNVLQQYGELSEEDFKTIGTFIYDNFGINLYPKKKLLLQSRLQKRIKYLKLNSYKEYCQYLFKNKEEVIKMIDRITTNKTDFFRESDHFDFLEKYVLGEINDAKPNNDLNIWSAGCSTGQEAYSIAMTLENIRRRANLQYVIQASDISLSVLETANKAIYPLSLLNQIPVGFRNKFLLKSKNKANKSFRIAPELRNKIQFSFYNLLEDKTFYNNTFNIIFCRNTLIYFDNETQRKVIRNLIDNLEINGLLFLGHSESLINMGLPIQAIFPSVYQKIK